MDSFKHEAVATSPQEVYNLEDRLSLLALDTHETEPHKRPLWLPEDVYLAIIGFAAPPVFVQSSSAFYLPSSSETNRDRPSYSEDRQMRASRAFLAAAALVSKQWSTLAASLLYRHLFPYPAHAQQLVITLHQSQHLRALVQSISTRACPSFGGLLAYHQGPDITFPCLKRFETFQFARLATSSSDKSAIMRASMPAVEIASVQLVSLRASELGGKTFLSRLPLLRSLVIHADWDSDFASLQIGKLPSLKSLSLRIFFLETGQHIPPLKELLPQEVAHRLEYLQLSFWSSRTVGELQFDLREVLDGSLLLQTVSLNGIDVEPLLERGRLPGLRTIELVHVCNPPRLPSMRTWRLSIITPEGTRSRLLSESGLVSFGHRLEDVDAAEETPISVPKALLAHLDRTRLPALTTLAVKSLDFSLPPHRTGRLVLRHVKSLHKIGMRIVDRNGVEFGAEKEGWDWGSVVEEKEQEGDMAGTEE